MPSQRSQQYHRHLLTGRSIVPSGSGGSGLIVAYRFSRLLGPYTGLKLLIIDAALVVIEGVEEEGRRTLSDKCPAVDSTPTSLNTAHREICDRSVYYYLLRLLLLLLLLLLP